MKRITCRLCKSRKANGLIILILLTVALIGTGQEWIKTAFLSKRTGQPLEVIHLAAVSCGRPNYQGIRDIRKPMDLTVTMVKSASLFSKAPLHVHVFTEEDMISMFETEFQSWPSRIVKRVKFTLYKIDYDKHISHKMAAEWKKWYKPCGSYRLFLPMILKDVTTAAIYSDSDIVFTKPIDELWLYLKQLEGRQVMAVSPTTDHPLGGSVYNENFIPHTSGLFQINSGVLVMNFTRMLNNDWLKYYDEQTSKSAVDVPRYKYGTDLLLTYYNRFRNSAEHDQKLLNIIFHYNPDFIKQLPCSWNFKSNFCQDDDNTCKEAETGDGAGAVHGITSAFYGNVNPTFRALYEVFLRYDFEEDIENKLLNAFRKQLELTAGGSFCKSKAFVITKPLAKSVRQVLQRNMLH